jgi:hypothetical protein
MILYWITGANKNGLKQGTVEDVKSILLNYIKENPEKPRGPKRKKKKE